MKRRTLLALVSAAGIGGFSGCISGNGNETGDTDDEKSDETGDTDDEEPEEEDESEDMAGGYDFSPCEYDLNDEKISHSPLDETLYNSPWESDNISVGVGYYEDIEDDELQELEGIFGDDATHHEGSQSYSTGRDGIHKCDVVKLSHRDYVEYIVPLPVDEE